MTHKFEALICAVLFTFWSVRLYYKLYDKKVRRYVVNGKIKCRKSVKINVGWKMKIN